MSQELEFFKAFTERQRIFNDFVRAVGEHKLRAAQAELNRALAAEMYVRARILRAALAQLQAEYKKLLRAEKRQKDKIAAIQKKAREALYLLRGRRLPSMGYAAGKRAYKYFEVQAMLEGDETLFDIEFPPTEIEGTDFINNRDPDRPCEAPPHSGDSMNVLELMDWAMEKRYIARTGSKAQQYFVKLFKAIDSVAANDVKTLREYAAAVRKGYYDTWTPAAILSPGVEATPTQKKILETIGTKAAA